MRAGEDAFHYGRELFRPERAVDAERRNAERFERRHHRFDARAEEGRAVRLEAHRCEYGQPGIFLRRYDGGLEFVEVRKGFEQYEVRALALSGADDFRKHIDGLVEFEVARGLEHAAARADVERGVPAAVSVSRGPRVAHSGAHYAGERSSGLFGLEAVRAEGVRENHVGPRFEVFLMYRRYLAGRGQVQRLRHGPELEAAALEHRPHSAVEEQDFAHVYHFAHSPIRV